MRFIIINKRIPKINSYLINDFLFYTKVNLKISKGNFYFCSDKIKLKEYLIKKINKKNILETISIIKDKKDIAEFILKKNQIIKPSHMSGAIIFTNKFKNIIEIKKIMHIWLNTDFYSFYREKNYKNLEKRILVENDLTVSSNVSDLKVFCYNGKIKFFQIDFGRFTKHKRQFLDLDWNLINVQWQYEQLIQKFKKPIFFNNIIESCNVIAKDFDFVRIDFLITESQYFCNELTFVPGKAEDKFNSIIDEKILSKYFFS